MSLVGSLIIVSILLIMFWLIYKFSPRRLGFPPGPDPLPFIGNFHQIDLAYPHRTFLKWKKKYGNLFTIWLPKPVIVIADYDVLKQALIKQGDDFAGRPMSFLYGIFFHHQPDGDGIILSQNENWLHQRRFALRVFRDFGMGKNLMVTKINHHTNFLIKNISEQRNQAGVANLHLPIAFCVGNIIQDLVLGKSYDYGNKDFLHFKKLIDAVLGDVASVQMLMVDSYPWLRHFLPTYYRYYKNGFALQNFFLEHIDNHEKNYETNGEVNDFIYAYIQRMKKQNNNGHYNKVSLAINAGDLWTGGMETTVTTLRWVIIYLIHHPEIQNRIYNEINEKIGSKKVEWGDRNCLPFVLAVIYETQRIINILPWHIPHATIRDTYLNGYFIPKGTTIMPQLGTILLDEKVFPNAETFDPTRFLNEDNTLRIYEEFIPFGMGKRSCLGESLARMELFIILTNLVQNFRFSPAYGVLPSLNRSPGMASVPQEFQCLIETRFSKNLSDN